MSFVAFAIVAIFAAGNAVSATDTCSSQEFVVDLPRQPLDDRLMAISRLSGCAVATADVLPTGKRVKAIRGTFTAEELYWDALLDTGFSMVPEKGYFALHGPA